MHLVSVFQLQFKNDPIQYITNNVHDLITFINRYFETHNIKKVYGLNTIYKYIQRRTYKKHNIDLLTSTPIRDYFKNIYLNKYNIEITKSHRLTVMKRLNRLYTDFITENEIYKEIPKIRNEQEPPQETEPQEI